ncbi:nitroreductase family protein [Mucilaginibacter sp.]
MNEQFNTVADIIKSRRTIKPATMNGRKIAREDIEALIGLADWAPTHGLTEPWRFIVYEQPAEFCRKHAELYQQNTAEENFKPAVHENLTKMGDNASHIVVAYMKRGSNPNIPQFEEIAATACAIENFLLGATAAGIGAYWGTGGQTLKPAMKEYLGLAEEDQVMGLFYLGYADEQPQGKRKTPLEEKVQWIA